MERLESSLIEDLFVAEIADALYALDGVEAVALGGSRAAGLERPDSDWDFGLYYRGAFDPQQVRDLGYDGYVSELGEWGGGLFNGGAWLRIHGRKVDVMFRDLDVVEYELAQAQVGRFHREPLFHHLAGMPSYLVVAELSVNRVLRGALPRAEFPEALRRSAPPVWLQAADLLFDYARTNYAVRGQVTECAGLLAWAAMCVAHAVLAARGQWCVNEKSMLERAGLRGIDDIVLALSSDPSELTRSVNEVQQLCRKVRQ